VADAYSLSVSWGDVLFDKAIRDASHDYVLEMVAAGHLTTDICRAVVDKCVSSFFCHLRSFLPRDAMLARYTMRQKNQEPIFLSVHLF